MDVLGWIFIALLLCLVLAVLTYLRQSLAVGGDGGGSNARRPQEVDVGPGGRRPGGRRRGPIMTRQARENSDEEEARDEELEELEEAGIKVPDGKIGKKKLEKLQAKADKKLQREAEQKEREENKKKRDKLEEEEKLQREKEKEEERLQEEEERRIRAEKERKEQEEYEKLKAAFSVEDEGCDAEDAEDEENKLIKFINYIKETKVRHPVPRPFFCLNLTCPQVVLLEDLAAQFKLKTQEAIDRVNQLQEDGLLTGVIDDRGKFIYISREELEAVAKFIKQQGRVSIADLAMNSNKLVTL